MNPPSPLAGIRILRSTRSRVLAPALAAFIMLVVPAASFAEMPKSLFVIGGPSPRATFGVKGSNGYWIVVSGAGRRVTLSPENRNGFAEYIVRGRASPDGIRARSAITAEWRLSSGPQGRVSQIGPPRHCEGQAEIIRYGVFVGTISFVGEQGYTRVHRVHAKGRTRTSPRWKCKYRRRSRKPPPDNSPESDVITLLKARAVKRNLTFEVIGSRHSGSLGIIGYNALLIERRGSMRIWRFVLLFAYGWGFKFDESLASATVTPPKPFEGKGSFRSIANGTTRWTGSLTVSLLGAKDIPLTGSRFEASLIQF